MTPKKGEKPITWSRTKKRVNNMGEYRVQGRRTERSHWGGSHDTDLFRNRKGMLGDIQAKKKKKGGGGRHKGGVDPEIILGILCE